MTMTVTYLAFAKAPVFFIKLITRLTVRTLSVFGFALSAMKIHHYVFRLDLAVSEAGR